MRKPWRSAKRIDEKEGEIPLFSFEKLPLPSFSGKRRQLSEKISEERIGIHSNALRETFLLRLTADDGTA
jgi:hypothetical protein